MSLLSAALNTVVVFPLTTVPSVLPSCANDGVANATGTTAAIKRVEIRLISLHLSPGCRDYLTTLQTYQGEQLPYRENFSQESCEYVPAIPKCECINYKLFGGGIRLRPNFANSRACALRVVQFRRSSGATGHDKSHRLVDGPIKHDETADRNQFHVTRSGVRRGRDVNRGDFLTGVGVVENPGNEAASLHPRRWKLDQDHALGTAGLGLKTGDELAGGAVDRLHDRNSRHQVVERAEQAPSRDGGRDLAQDVQRRQDDRNRNRSLKPRRGKSFGERRRMNPQPRYASPYEWTAECHQQPNQETDDPNGDEDGNGRQNSRYDIATDLCEHRCVYPPALAT